MHAPLFAQRPCAQRRSVAACAVTGKGFGDKVEKPAPQKRVKQEPRGMKLKIPQNLAAQYQAAVRGGGGLTLSRLCRRSAQTRHCPSRAAS